MADPVVECQRQFGRRRIVAERVARGRGDRRMIEIVALGKERKQLGHRVRQHGRQRIDAFPLPVGQGRGRQPPQAGERRDEPLVRSETG